ncbi:hypothetical protein QYF36_021254 [Acer negundo]|nr:hypothetical protein QYF36_021254 [Acer negundo]
MKSKERDKGNSNSKSSLDKGDCGQLKNKAIKALDGSGELLRSVEARTRDEEARSQEVGKVILMKSKERDRGRRQKMGEKIDQHMGDWSRKDIVKLSKSFGLCSVAVWPASLVGFVVSSCFLATILPLA